MWTSVMVEMPWVGLVRWVLQLLGHQLERATGQDYRTGLEGNFL